jgi:hypothetical protein
MVFWGGSLNRVARSTVNYVMLQVYLRHSRVYLRHSRGLLKRFWEQGSDLQEPRSPQEPDIASGVYYRRNVRVSCIRSWGLGFVDE